MKHISIFLLTGLLIFGKLFAQLGLQDSLVAWYPFDGTAIDQSPNGNNGTLIGAVYGPDRFGSPSSAVELDGSNDYVSFTNNQKFQPQLPVTIAAWVKIDDFGYNMVFNNDFEENYYNGVWMNIAAGGVISVVYADGGPVGPSSRRTYTSNASLTLNTWYHVAVIVRGLMDADIYIDGKKDCGYYHGNGEALSYAGNDGVAGRSDGFSQPGPNEYYHGSIDDLRFYNRELGQDEIRELADFSPQIDTLDVCLGDSIMLDAGFGTVI